MPFFEPLRTRPHTFGLMAKAPAAAGVFDLKGVLFMCAIAGIIDFDGRELHIDEEKLLETMARRGPDQRGAYRRGPARLFHTRLAVVDPEGGKQPFLLSARGGLALVYNGELYNTVELRNVLVGLGHRFEGHSDTEVVAHAYAEWGADCVKRFNGIFAFAVWEEERRRLFLARDRMGVKPLFFSMAEDRLCFASELKTLLECPGVSRRVGREGLLEVMLLGPGRTPGCGVFQDIRELEGACCAYWSRTGWRTWKYWTPEDLDTAESFEDAAAHVRELVTDAVERQLVSDVPVCTFLSGGLDSSIISAIADKEFHLRDKTLHTFSVTYKDNAKYFAAGKFQPNSDDDFIGLMAGSLHGEHHRIVLDSGDVAAALYEATEARDLPGMADVDSSLLLFCREVKKHATVALSGECADEIFGGYPCYRDPSIREREGFPWAQSTGYRASFLRPEVLAGTDPVEFVDSRYRATVAETPALPGRAGLERRMRELMWLNLRWFMQTLLDRKDRMSMWSGLEVRVPFCDWRIVQYLYTVPWAYKDWQGREKGLLRQAMTGFLPEEILWRKKSPYPKTHHPAYLEAVSGMLREVLDRPNAPLLDVARREVVEELLADRSHGAGSPWYGQLMARPQTIAYLVQVNHWLEHYHIELV